MESEWFGLDINLKDHLIPTSLHEQGHPSLDQFTYTPTKSGLEHHQVWGVHNSSGQPLPLTHHPYSTDFFLNI